MTVEILFSHSGAMFAYYLGIAEVLKEYDLSDVVFSATSGGCFPCILLNTGKDIRTTFNNMLDYIENNNNSWENIIKGFLTENITDEDIELLNKKFCCKLTKLNSFLLPEKVSVDEWNNKEDFVQCIGAACFVPLMCGNKFYTEYRNEKVIDGFFSGTSSIPVTTNKVLHFHPNMWRTVNPTWLLPSTDKQWLKALYELGYMDALNHKSEFEGTLKMKTQKEIITQNDSV